MPSTSDQSMLLADTLDDATVATQVADSSSPVKAIPRRRILVSAYTLSPKRGSEPAGAWNVITRLAAYHDITVITSPNVEGTDYRVETMAYLARNPIAGLTLEYVAPPPLAKKLMKPTGSLARLLYYIGYAAWQRAAFARARELHAAKPFDLAHQLNMTGYREPGYLWRLDAPFVWGPIGGAANVPLSFLPMMSWKDRAFITIRNLANLVQRRTNRRCRKAAEKARLIWHIGSDEKQLIEQAWKRDIAEPMLDSGTISAPRDPVHYDGKRPLRIVWSGVHIGRKALPILLQAIASIRHTHRVELTVLGQGPQTEAWDTLAARLGITDRIRWMGQLPRENAVDEMMRADVLAFTSLSEGAPYVVLEAISMGLPVICHDCCGMAVAIDDTCGMKVPLLDRQTSVRGFTGALVKLCTNPKELERLTAGMNRRATELTWDSKVEQIVAGYERVLAAPPLPPTGDELDAIDNDANTMPPSAIAPAAPAEAPVEEPEDTAFGIVVDRPAAPIETPRPQRVSLFAKPTTEVAGRIDQSNSPPNNGHRSL